jgi:hypothetical protein
VVPDVSKEYKTFILKLPEQFQKQYGWMRCIEKVLLVGKVVSQAGDCGRGLDVQL